MSIAISTHHLTQTRIRQMQAQQEKIERAQHELASEHRHQKYTEIADESPGGVERTMHFYQQKRRIEFYDQNNTPIIGRFNVVSKALGDIHSELLSFKKDAMGQTGVAYNDQILRDVSKATLENIRQIIIRSKSESGSPLFSGDSQKEPFKAGFDITVKSNIVQNKPTAIYYAGSRSYMELEVGDRYKVKLQVTAASPEIAKAFASVHLALRRCNSGQPDDLKQSIVLADQALREINELQTSLNHQIKDIKMKMNRNVRDHQDITKLLSDEVDSDKVRASTESKNGMAHYELAMGAQKEWERRKENIRKGLGGM